MKARRLRVLAAAGAASVAVLAGAVPAQAAGTFKCTATGAKIGATSVAVANPLYSPCLKQRVAQPIDFALPANPLLGLTVESVYGRTVPNARVNAQAYAGAVIVNIALLGFDVRLEVVESSSTVSCSGGKPHLFNRGGVTDLHINGVQVIDFENDPRSFSIPGLGSLAINQTTKTANEITFTAFKLTPAAIFPAITLADTKAGFAGNPCTA